MRQKKIAIVYDWIDKWGGAERVLLAFSEMFPEADFYTSYVDYDKAGWAKKLKIKTSFLQKFPDFIKKNRILSLPFYPYAFESFNFSGYDLVISITSSFAKGIITKPDTKHICYLLTPTRYLWTQTQSYIRKNSVYCLTASPVLKTLREWDFIAAQRPDTIISLSRHISYRCEKYYIRKSEVVYPPFDIEYWRKIKSQISNIKYQKGLKFQILNTKYYLLVSRLEPYKKIDLAIDVFNKLGKRLIVVGSGTDEKKLKQMAGKNILFFKDLGDKELVLYYKNAHALIMPQDEDFGLTALEAQFFGCPIITYKGSGTVEAIVERKTGIVFNEQSKQSLMTAIESYDKIAYNVKILTKKFGRKHVEKFSKSIFIKNFSAAILNL